MGGTGVAVGDGVAVGAEVGARVTVGGDSVGATATTVLVGGGNVGAGAAVGAAVAVASTVGAAGGIGGSPESQPRAATSRKAKTASDAVMEFIGDNRRNMWLYDMR